MKIAHLNKNSEKKTLDQLLINYRDTSHQVTGLPPATKVLRDDKEIVLPRQFATDIDVLLAK